MRRSQTRVSSPSAQAMTLAVGTPASFHPALWRAGVALVCAWTLAHPALALVQQPEAQPPQGGDVSIAEPTAVAIEGVTRVCPAEFAAFADATASFAVLDRSIITSAEFAPAGLSMKFASTGTEPGSSTVTIAIDAGTSLYGLGPAAGSLLRNGQRHECWSGDPAQAAWPWILAVRADGTAFGLLADTTRACRVDLSATADQKAGDIVFGLAGGPPAMLVIEGRDPAQVLERLSQVIGTPALAPSWAYGFIQHAGSSQAQVLASAETLRQQKLPASGLLVTPPNSQRYLAFDSDQFPDPRAMIQRLTQQGFSAAWFNSPWVPDVPGNVVRDQLVNSKFALREGGDAPSAARPISGTATPATTGTPAHITPDLARADVREWWGKMHADLFGPKGGVAALVLDPQAERLQTTARSLGGTWLEGQTLAPVELGDAPGAWGLLTTGAAHAAIESQRKGLRVAGFTTEPTIGSGRYAAPVLSPLPGEAAASFDNRLLSTALSGQPFLGANLSTAGGQSWSATAALLPIAIADAADQAKSDADSVRQTLERRARLMPYLYSCAARADASGTPMLAPVFMASPSDPALRAESGAFLLGPDVLIAAPASASPILDALKSSSGGVAWERVHLVGEGANPSLPQLHIRPGAIVPIGPIVQSTQDRHEGPLVLLVNLNADGQASGELYEDFGDSTEYRGGKFLRTTYTATLTGSKCQLQIASKEGTHPRGRRDVLVVLLRPDGWFMTIKGTDGMGLGFDLSRIEPVAMNEHASVPGRDAVPPRSSSGSGK